MRGDLLHMLLLIASHPDGRRQLEPQLNAQHLLLRGSDQHLVVQGRDALVAL